MADSKISALTALTGANSAPGDLLEIVDISDTTMAASGTNKKITREELQTFSLGTITADKKCLDLSATWNAAGVAFTGIKLNITNTASAAGSKLLDLQVGSSSRVSFDKDFALYGSDNLLELRDGTSGQTLNIYNTYTDASNYERSFIRWVSNRLELGCEKAGTGTDRNIRFVFTTSVEFSVSGPTIGTNYMQVPSAGFFSFGSRFYCQSPADGKLVLYNWAGNDFSLLQFGGTSSSFPALKRSTTKLQTRLADDSAFALHQAKLQTDTNYTAGAPTPTGYLVVYDAAGTGYKIPAEAV
jgi:hypothetical protein